MKAHRANSMPTVIKRVSPQGSPLGNVNILMVIPVISIEPPNRDCAVLPKFCISTMMSFSFFVVPKHSFLVMIKSVVVHAVQQVLGCVQGASFTWRGQCSALVSETQQ